MAIKMMVLDWIAMKKWHLFFIVIIPMMFIFGIVSVLLIIPVCAWMAGTMATTPFSVEDKGDLNRLYLTLPVPKRSIVKGRFLMTLLFVAVFLIAGIAFTMLFGNILRFSPMNSALTVTGTDYLVLTAVSVLISAVFVLCNFPIYYGMGYARGKFLSVPLQIIFMYAIMFGVILAQSYDPGIFARFFSFAQRSALLLSGIILAVSAIMYYVAYIISVKVFSKRSF